MSAKSRSRTRATLRVNPIACDAHGVCAELFPERISLDEWGFPIIDGHAIEDDLVQHAKRAADGCPRAALLLKITRD
jgi:ferredoxin